MLWMLLLDACMIITFGNAVRLDLIDGLQAHPVGVSTRVRGEVSRDPARGQMEASIAAGRLTNVEIDLENAGEVEALARYDGRMAFQNRGDAEVLALAACRGYLVASDERAVRSVVVSERGSGGVAGTLDFVRWAVVEGRLAIGDADSILRRLDSGPQILAQIAARGQRLSDLILPGASP